MIEIAFRFLGEADRREAARMPFIPHTDDRAQIGSEWFVVVKRDWFIGEPPSVRIWLEKSKAVWE